MDKKYTEIEPPAYLLGKIMERIEKEERILMLKKRIAFFFTGLFGLMTGLIYVFRLAQTTIVESGFSQYFSLLFSDTAIVTNYWQNFFITLLETFPITETAVSLFFILLILQVIKFLAKDFKNIKNLQIA